MFNVGDTIFFKKAKTPLLDKMEGLTKKWHHGKIVGIEVVPGKVLGEYKFSMNVSVSDSVALGMHVYLEDTDLILSLDDVQGIMNSKEEKKE